MEYATLHRPLRTLLAIAPWLIAAGCDTSSQPFGVARASLQQVSSFGANPGNLLMYRYEPTSAVGPAPLVVTLHACGQSAADYTNAGWNDLADRYGFYVVYAQQQSANNSALCFNWSFDPASPTGIQRGQGENESIKEMVDQMKTDFSIDASRVFVTGFSAGGAAAIEMMALWPEVFAGGASLAGIPFDCAANLADVNKCVSPGVTKTAASWGDLVRQADPGYSGSYPRLVVWQGLSDSVVGPANSTELVKQWTNVFGVDATADATSTTGSITHQQFENGAGVTLVDSFSVSGFDHGMMVDPTHGCGTVSAPYFLDGSGVCTSALIAEAWGLAVTKMPAVDASAPVDLAAHDGATSLHDLAVIDAAPLVDAAGASTHDAGGPIHDAGGPIHDAGGPIALDGGGSSLPPAADAGDRDAPDAAAAPLLPPASGCAVTGARSPDAGWPTVWMLLLSLLMTRLGRKQLEVRNAS